MIQRKDFYTEGFSASDEALPLIDMIAAELYGYDGRMGIYLNDLRGHVISLNKDEIYETASCCKMFVLSALFQRIREGSASLSDMLCFEERFAINGSGILSSLEPGTKLSVKNLATLMIIISDNIATNILIDYVGLSYINEHIKALSLTNSKLHNPIDFTRYKRLGSTSPWDYGRLWTLLCERKLSDSASCEAMLDICSRQKYNRMLTGKLPYYFLDEDNYNEPENKIIWVSSKSGSMNACRNDGGIVHTPYGEYVIVLLNKDFSDMAYHDDHPAYTYGQSVSRLVFDWYIARKGSF